VNPSEAVLVGVANALQCSPLETRHLFVLAGLTPPETTQVSVCEGISPGTRRMLDSLMPQPASIQKPNFDIVAWNDSFCRLMGVDFATLPEETATVFISISPMTPGAAVLKIAMCCRRLSPISARRWPNTGATRCGKISWRAFLPPPPSLKRCGISAMTCAAWKIR
jgi:hypothetical protein